MAMRIHGTVKRPYEWNKSLARIFAGWRSRWKEISCSARSMLNEQVESAAGVGTESVVDSVTSSFTP